MINLFEERRRSTLMNSYLQRINAETKTVLNYAAANGIAVPNRIGTIEFDLLISCLKDSGVWAYLDICYSYMGNAPVGFKNINIVNPTKYKPTTYGGAVYGNNGLQANGYNTYVDTGFNVSALSGTKYQANSASFGFLVTYIPPESDGEGGPLIGVNTSRGYSIFNSKYYYVNINQDYYSDPIVDMSGVGLIYADRYDTNRHGKVLVRETATEITYTQSGILNSGANEWLFYRPYIWGNLCMGLFFCGSSIPSTNLQSLRDMLNTMYLPTIGLSSLA